MSLRCIQCGTSTIWDDDVGSAVCTSCGSLADPSQSVLTSSQYNNQNNTLDASLWDSSASTTLKSLRVGNNWDLAGQGKESRDRKNAYAMAEFIKSLAVSLNAPGLSPRAINLFTQARALNRFRWGKKSRSVAAACLAIALRESNRPDSLRDVASILNVPPASVIHEFTHLNFTLNLTLSLVDPSVHISMLQAHLSSSLNEHQQEFCLPETLVNSLRNICLRSVANTATSLSEVLTRFCSDHDVLRLPAPPTACGIFLLALEAENRALLNPLGDLAQCLGSRCHISKSVVMTRYKIIQDEIASWVEKIPWLEKYENKKGRAKVAKRLVVARGLKDVIRFQEDIWKQKEKPSLELELTKDEIQEDENDPSLSLEVPLRPPKRRKLDHAMTQATQFLLDPLGTPVSSPSNQRRLSSTAPHHLTLATYILANPSNHLSQRQPTRLQLLTLMRGGVNEDQIPDEDLFAEGEFEKLIRGQDEIRMLRETFGWKEGKDYEDQSETEATSAKDEAFKKRTHLSTVDLQDGIIHGTALYPQKKSRLNMEALAQFMVDPSDIFKEDTFDSSMIGLEQVINDEDEHSVLVHDDIGMGYDTNITVGALSPPRCRRSSALGANDADEVILEGWRPSSPERTASDTRYDEEYH